MIGVSSDTDRQLRKCCHEGDPVGFPGMASAKDSSFLVRSSQLVNGKMIYYLVAKATANAGATRYSATVPILVTSGLGGLVVSDDFNQLSVNQQVWQQFNPLGDGTFATI